MAAVAELARELLAMQDRPLVAHASYSGTGKTADGDALALVECNSYRAVECSSLSAVLERSVVSLSLCLCVSVSTPCLSVSVSTLCLPVCLSLCLSVHLTLSLCPPDSVSLPA